MTGRTPSLAIAASTFGLLMALLAAPARAGIAPASPTGAAPGVAAPDSGLGPDTTLWSALAAPRSEAPGANASSNARVIARGDRFEILRDGKTTPIFFRGVNLGAAPPGHFPGEFAIGFEEYRRWIRLARNLHANALRVYALHPPDFYRALREENLAHPGRPIWLFQEVWTELPETNDFWTPAYRRDFEREIRMSVDAVHGNAAVKPRPGHASGRYEADVSPWLAGWILGREWEPYAVRETERLNPDSVRYDGEVVAVPAGTAMECWLGRVCDVTARYERRNYGAARAVSFVNWPTLDPIRHPTETERGGAEAEHDEDAYSVDPLRLKPRLAVGDSTGFFGYFVNYHAYPYYPDFMNLDPGYAAFRDRHGACSYAGYLEDLKAHTRGVPLLIGEYGVPSSRGIAHLQPQGLNHGGESEPEQGLDDVRLLEDIAESDASGALLFSLFDEWFKVNWMVQRVEQPRERDPLWHNVLDPEECYGLVGFDPPPAVRIDGDLGDWRGVAPYAVADSASAARGTALLRALYATSDQTHFYLRIDLPPRAAERGIRSIGVAFDVLDAARGDHRLPAPLDATWSRGAEFVLLLEPALASRDDGPRRASLFADARTRYSEFARVRNGAAYGYLRAPYRPVENDDGLYHPLVVETNRERVSRDGRVFPAQYLNAGRLAYGAEWRLDDARRSVEIAIPWGLLGVGDPSSHAVIDDRDGTNEIETTRTPGIALLAWASTAPGGRADSLGPAVEGARLASPKEVAFLGPQGTLQAIEGHRVNVTSPEGGVVVWNGWEMPITTEHVKSSARLIREAFEGMEARETKEPSNVGAGP
jgi:hypothetical protein